MNQNQLVELFIVPSYRFHCHIIAILFKNILQLSRTFG